jgi:hypothetical protein
MSNDLMYNDSMRTLVAKPTHFVAQVIKVETMADGGIRLTLDMPETEIDAAAAMMKAKQQSALVECAALFVKPLPVNVRQDEKESKRYSPYTEAKKESKGKGRGKKKQ